MTSNANSYHEFLQKLIQITEANLQDEQFGVTELAQKMGMSRSNLHRKVHGMLKVTVSQYIRQKRLEKGLVLLHQSYTVSEVAWRVGFGSVTYFIKSFHDYYGYSPGKVVNNEQKKNIFYSKENRIKIKLKHPQILIAGVIVLLLFLIGIVYLRPLQSSKAKTSSQTIAVLPLQFKGDDSIKMIAEGICESLILSLMNIENVIIRTTTSAEQNNKSIKSLKQIGREQNVDYIIEIKGQQKSKSDTRLQLKFTDVVNDKNLWENSYLLNLNKISHTDLFDVIRSEITRSIGTDSSPYEKQALKLQPSINPAANLEYDLGRNLLSLKNKQEFLSQRNENFKKILEAKYCINKAIKIDPSFSAAYTVLAHIYIDNLFLYTNNESFLDSGLMMVEKAFSLDGKPFQDLQYRWLLNLKSKYYLHKGQLKESKHINEEIESLIDLTDYTVFADRAAFYSFYEEYFQSIFSFYKYCELHPDVKPITPSLYMYRILFYNLYFAGFPEEAESYLNECQNIYSDSLTYWFNLSYDNFCTGNYYDCLKNASKVLELDAQNYHALYWIMSSFFFLHDYENALKYAHILEKRDKGDDYAEFIGYTSFRVTGLIFPEIAGCLYQKTGNEQKALQYFSDALEKYLYQINSHTLEAAKYESQFGLALTYSARGEKTKALHYLEEVDNRSTIPSWMIVCLENWPLFDNIRNEPEFQKLKKKLEKKYQKEHARIDNLLQEKERIRNGRYFISDKKPSLIIMSEK